MYKNLIFDFGNVLIESDFPLLLERITREIEPDERRKAIQAEFREIVFSRQFTQQLDLGHKPARELFEELKQQHPTIAPYIQAFYDRWMEHLLGEMPGMRMLLERYKAKGLKLYGLSNWSDMIYQVMEQYPIFGLLDGQVISCEEHLIKPDPAIYRRLLEKYQLQADACVFVDDKQENVLAAEEIGMKGILFKNADRLNSELKILLN